MIRTVMEWIAFPLQLVLMGVAVWGFLRLLNDWMDRW